jgi:hypothetical protein
MATEVHFAPGLHISEAATLLAREGKNGNAFGVFNDIRLDATPASTIVAIVADYDRISKERAEAYRRSPEGIAAAQRSDEERRALQDKHDTLVAQLETLDWNNDVAVLDWCCSMQEPSDRVGIIIKKDTILAAFARHGYTPNMRTGSDFMEDVRRVHHAYLIGQALAGLQSVAIHGIIHDFADRWKQKFGVSPPSPDAKG